MSLLQSEEAIRVESVSKRFGRRWALADVSFSARAGEVVAVLGKNGSGKSTLLRCIATILRPDRGRIRVAGVDSLDRLEVRRRLAYLGHATQLYEGLSARANLEVVSTFLPPGHISIDAALEMAGLPLNRREAVSSFSAGMRRRVAMARLLMKVSSSSIVLLDEPHSSLDQQGFAVLDSFILRWRDEGRTILIATHLADEVSRLSSRQIRLDGGRLTSEAPAA